MELLFQRTDAAADMAGHLVAVWSIRRTDKQEPDGIALVAEIIPVGAPLTQAAVAVAGRIPQRWRGGSEAAREALAAELNEPGATMRLWATPALVHADIGDTALPARMWLGHSGRGTPLATMVSAVRASNPEFERVLELQFAVLQTDEKVDDVDRQIEIDPNGPLR